MKDDRPTLRERYTHAISASRLTLTDRPGDVDVLIAAGWIKETLATQLYRLLAEFDTARGDMRIADAEQQRLAKAQSEASQLAEDEHRRSAREWRQADAGPHRGAQHDAAADRAADNARRASEEATAAAMQARAFAMLQLKTLNATKQAIYTYAEQAANRRRELTLSSEAVARIVGRVIEAMLDPLCPGCKGSGKVGVYPDQKLHTGKGPSFCGGSGRRRVSFSVDPAGELFGRWLLADLERKTARVDALLAKFLVMTPNPTALPAGAREARDELAKRLDGLRSAEAALD